MPTFRGPAFVFGNAVDVDGNFLDADASYVVAGMEPEYLRTEEPTEVARLSTIHPTATRWSVDFIGRKDIGGMGLINSSLSPWGLYRFSEFEPAFTRTAPTSIISSDNAVGVVGNVDEDTIGTPDANYISADIPGPFTVRLEFATPAADDYHQKVFVVTRALISSIGAGHTVAAYPWMLAVLYQGSTQIATLGRRPIMSTTDEIYVFSFDYADLPDPTGANTRVEFQFYIGSQRSVLDVVTALHPKLSAVDLRWEQESTAGLEDSGWLTSPLAAYENDDPLPSSDLLYWPTVEWNVQNVWVSVADDQSHAVATAPTNNILASGHVVSGYRLNYTEAGVFVAGDAEFMNSAILINDTAGGNIIIESIGGATVGGQTYSVDAFRRRTITVPLVVTRAQLRILQDRLAYGRGYSGAFLFAQEPDISNTYQKYTSGWYTLKSMTDPTRLPMSRYDDGSGELLYNVTIVLEEKL